MKIFLPLALLLTVLSAACAQGPDWNQVRSDHPRLYCNADTWPEIKARAEGPLAAHFARVCKAAEGPRPHCSAHLRLGFGGGASGVAYDAVD